MRRIVNSLLPLQSQRRAYVKRLLRGQPKQAVPKPGMDYSQWIQRLEPNLWSHTDKESLAYQPLISIVVPCYNTPERYLKPLMESILNQLYSNWQLCLVNGSTDSDATKRIQTWAKKDARITLVNIAENLGIVGNTNKGIAIATGEFIGFLDHDDVLSEHALFEVAVVLNQDKKLDLIYSDEDKLTDKGNKRLLPFFKPDWSPELLLGVNYITHFVVVRKSLLDKLGGLRPGFDGAQDYDLLLRITEKTNKIKHIPKILYHWRLAEGSTSKNVSEKNYADTAGQRALKDVVTRRRIQAKVLAVPEHPTNYRLSFTLSSAQPKVSIIIPFKDKADLLKQCVGSILEKTTYKNYELILISNNSTEEKLSTYLDELSKNKHCRVFYWDHPFNYSAINNYGRQQAKGEYLVLLNNDTEVITPEWLEELIGVASQSSVGAVGPTLFYPNKTIQHAGVILGLGGMAGHVFRNHFPDDWTHFGMPSWPRNYLAVTGACLAIAVKKYDQVGGLDEKFTIAGNDVALGIRLYEAGYRNVYWPFCKLIHYENVSVGSYKNVPELDYNHSLEYYRPYLGWHDPYFNLNLDLMNEQIELRSNYE
jgi:glycosyltransferase involved in cell wall biosynthesis